ncbi:MAG: efflux RND transporter periplasmic adaptor subunit [Caldisericia bacterium]|nr:efflux RND transporter periplasmic adaptor subunit [Caldisericia bacterium]
MKKRLRNIIIIILVIVLISFISFYFISKRQTKDQKNIVFTTAIVQKGNIISSVSASGKIEPIDSYPVMASISGKIDKIYVDYNSKVAKGQILAIIKQDDYIYALKQAQLSYQEAQITLSQKELDYKNNLELFKKGFATEQTLKQSENSLKLAQIALESSKITLEKAKSNLENTILRSPIDGFVLERNVDEGDFISTNVSQKSLFIVCSDLSRLKITASVDESDISTIREGQKVSFTVLAYDTLIFNGFVKQIRLNSSESSNVVTYVVVIETKNIDNKLLPGMTASIEFLNETKEVAFLVPQTAISLKGIALMKTLGPYSIEVKNSDNNNQKDNSSKNFQNFQGKNFNNIKLIWVIDENRKLIYPIPVKVGNSDGKMVEVFSDKLVEGMKIISSLINTGKNQNSNFGMPPIRF